jgi:hypothetical protein
LKNHSKKESGLKKPFMIWSVRSYFDRLSTNGGYVIEVHYKLGKSGFSLPVHPELVEGCWLKQRP